jgi:hypothetical protein
MGLQSHAYSTLETELGLEPGIDTQFTEPNVMLVVAKTEEDVEDIMFALSAEFNPTLIKCVPEDGIAIRFDAMAYWTQGS